MCLCLQCRCSVVVVVVVAVTYKSCRWQSQDGQSGAPALHCAHALRSSRCLLFLLTNKSRSAGRSSCLRYYVTSSPTLPTESLTDIYTTPRPLFYEQYTQKQNKARTTEVTSFTTTVNCSAVYQLAPLLRTRQRPAKKNQLHYSCRPLAQM